MTNKVICGYLWLVLPTEWPRNGYGENDDESDQFWEDQLGHQDPSPYIGRITSLNWVITSLMVTISIMLILMLFMIAIAIFVRIYAKTS